MRRLARNPLLLGLVLLLSLWAHLLWNATLGAAVPALLIRVKVPWGFVADPVPLTAETVRTGAWQRAQGLATGAASWVQHDAVKWRNQIYYSLFGMSAVPDIFAGQGGQLFERAYMLDYCGRDLPKLAPQLTAWAQRLRAMDDAVTARGQVFRYLITPSKVATDPSILPRDLVCPVRAEDAAAKLPAYRTALAAAGVPVIDGPALISTLPGAPKDLFPRGGIHWNAAAAGLALDALAASLDGTRAALAPFTTSTHVITHPEGEERDLLDTLNLIIKADDYPVPVLDLHQPPGGPCRRPRLAFVSGSFGIKLARAFAALPCAPVIDFFFYWDRSHITFAGTGFHREPADPARRAAILRAADAIILEENDATLPGSVHAKSLAAWLEHNPAAPEGAASQPSDPAIPH